LRGEDVWKSYKHLKGAKTEANWFLYSRKKLRNDFIGFKYKFYDDKKIDMYMFLGGKFGDLVVFTEFNDPRDKSKLTNIKVMKVNKRLFTFDEVIGISKLFVPTPLAAPRKGKDFMAFVSREGKYTVIYIPSKKCIAFQITK